MRILQIAPPWFSVPPAGYGGIEQVVALLTDGLVDAGHDVTLCASGGSQTKATLVSVYDEPPSAKLGSTPHEVAHSLEAVNMASEFDVVHDHSGLAGAAITAAIADERLAVHTLHGDWKPGPREVYEALPPQLHLVAISHAQAERAPKGVRVAGVVPHGIDIDNFPFSDHARNGDGYLAYVGRAHKDKAPETAVQVARRLKRPLRMAVKVNEPPELQYWDEHVVPLLDGADVEVICNGDRGDAIEVMRQADATLMPIRWAEPFGLVMVESMACGTPVIAFARGAAKEVVADGRSGVLVPPDDIEAFCDAVERASDIEPQTCRDWVTERYSATTMVQGYDALYRRLLQQSPPQQGTLAAVS